MTLTNSTVSGNTATNGSGICGFNATLTNSTVSGNTATNGSDICAGTVTLTNSLVDGDCEGIFPLTSNGYNIESPGNTCGFDQTGDQSGVTAQQLNLGELAENGGLTKTHALGLLPTRSVAIDQIPAADCVDADGALLTEDQRGEPRPAGAESKCDVGAFERQSDDSM